MESRYAPPKRKLNFGSSGAFGSEPEKPRQPTALEEFLRWGSAAAPAVGTLAGAAIGGLAGGLPTAGAGAIPGAALGASLGGAAGMGAGSLMGMGAEKVAEGDTRAEEARVRRELERQARAQAAMQMLGGF